MESILPILLIYYVVTLIQDNLFYTIPAGAMETYRMAIESHVAHCEVNMLLNMFKLLSISLPILLFASFLYVFLLTTCPLNTLLLSHID